MSASWFNLIITLVGSVLSHLGQNPPKFVKKDDVLPYDPTYKP